MMTESNNPILITTTTVSAPGKILLAGGYLVLESPNVGIVLAVDKKFYSTVKVVDTNNNTTSTTNNSINTANNNEHAKVTSNNNNNNTTRIVVHSPQFGATWNYQAITTTSTTSKDTNVVAVQLTADPSNTSTNSFVEKTLRVSMTYLMSSFYNDNNNNAAAAAAFPPPTQLDITILADNDFYSVVPHLKARQWKATTENLQRLPKFLPCSSGGGGGGGESGTLQKTGLGSSAALVTSLVGALVLSFQKLQDRITLDTTTTTSSNMDPVTRRKIHNLAQVCHCHAQGKVGSGFDVSSASYGSHIYQRFPKCLLADLLAELDKQEVDTSLLSSSSSSSSSSLSPSNVQILQQLVDENPEQFQWPIVQRPLSWNTQLLQIMLADVSGGSESPSMARKVLHWKVTAEDKSCWTNLAHLNERVAKLCDDIVQSLEDCNANRIAEMTQALSQCKLDEATWTANKNNSTSIDESTHKTGKLVCDLRRTLTETRENLKRMGDLAQVPVEPDEQTNLANATMELPGVVASLVPGAGGYDAMVVVYVNTTQVRDHICHLWTNYKPLAVCPLAVQFAPYGDGLAIESETPEYYQPNTS